MNTTLLVRFFQLVAVSILLPVGILKFQGNPVDVYIFTTLEMEPFGRFLIGAIEIGTALLLLTSAFCAVGAIMGIGIMCGAIIAHVTAIGLSVQGDGGTHIVLLASVLLSCSGIAYLRRKEIPIVGKLL